MRIRTANGVGFVRLCVALVIVLVVMSGSAFGQDKQSGRAIKSTTSKNTGVQQRSGMGKTNSKKDAGATPLPVRKELEATIQTDPVYVEADRDDNNLKPHEARQPPSLITPPGEPANGGSGLPGGGSGSGSTQPSDPPIMQERCLSCSCPGDYAGPEFPDPNCNGLHKYYYEWVYTHSYDACAESQHTDLHICHSGRITAWKFNAIKYRFSNCSGVPDQNEPVFKQGNNATGLTHSAAGVDFPLCRQ
ncbi:MAG: hypothetical protein H9535_03120 [Ignavibacteria bacterium]|nr:hypothetical protein [Ignavibacteria bacterium]